MMKRIISILVCICMVFTFTPVYAGAETTAAEIHFAAQSGNVRDPITLPTTDGYYTYGTVVDARIPTNTIDSNVATLPDTGWTWAVKKETSSTSFTGNDGNTYNYTYDYKLILNNMNWNYGATYGWGAIYIPYGNVAIELRGDNSIKTTAANKACLVVGDTSNAAGINAHVIITGDGSLDLESTAYSGIRIIGSSATGYDSTTNLVISGGTLNIKGNGGSYAGAVYGDDTQGLFITGGTTTLEGNSAGFYTNWSSYADFQIIGGTTTIIGTEIAIKYTSGNALKVGAGTTIKAGDSAASATETTESDKLKNPDWKYINVTHQHDHNWIYAQDTSNSINVTCDAAGCPASKGGTVTLSAPSDKVYTGSNITATISGDFGSTGKTVPPASDITYQYKSTADGEYTSVTDTSTPGWYKASLTLDGKTASVEYKIEKAEGPAAPTGLTPVKPSRNGADDGKITGTNASMEWSTTTDFTTKTVCTGDSITGLAAGTYYVRLAETTTQKAGAYATVVVPDGEIPKYDVTFETNGGSAVSPQNDTVEGNKVTKPDDPTRTGYTFDGWYTDDNTFGNPWNFNTDTVEKDTTLYAKWTANEYKVTFDANEGSADYNEKNVTFDDTYEDLPSATRGGYTFDGWFTQLTEGSEVKSSTSVTEAQDHTLYARWTPIPATDPALTTSGDLSLTYGYPTGSNITVTATPAQRHSITGYQWYSCDENGQNGQVIADANRSTYTIPTGNDAGKYYYYCVVSTERDDNNQTATASSNVITVTVEKKSVNEPTIENKAFTGKTQKADIQDTDLYTVNTNQGGTAKGTYDVVLELKDADNYKWSSTDDAKVTLEFKITAATNSWIQEPEIEGWTYGNAACTPTAYSKYGQFEVIYTGTAYDGTSWNNEDAPEKAGDYTATFTVEGTEDYEGLTKAVNFTIEKANYDMSAAIWEYNGAFDYDGLEKTVTVTGLPSGVTVGSYTDNSATIVGNYTAKVTLSYDGYNYNEPTIDDLAWSIKNDWTPNEYTTTVSNTNGWLNTSFQVIAAEGFELSLTNTEGGVWESSLVGSDQGENNSITFYLRDKNSGKISLAVTEYYSLDIAPPSGSVTVNERAPWQSFINDITFGLFFKDEVTVKIEATDALSGIDKVEYISSDESMTLDQVKGGTSWNTYTDKFGVTLEDAKKFVYYVRITDNAGNEVYLSTDGMVYDTSVPVIQGVENNKVYYTTQKVTVVEDNVHTITVDGLDAGKDITLDGNIDRVINIQAIDKAGNATLVTVQMKPISVLSVPIDSLTNDNVNSDSEQVIDDVIAAVAAVDTANATDAEKSELKTIADKANELKKVIADTKTELSRINEEVQKYDMDTVKSSDKVALEQLLSDIEKQLESTNMTENETSQLNSNKGAVEALLTKISDIETLVNDYIDDTATYNNDTVKSSDKDAIENIIDGIDALLGGNNLTEAQRETLEEAKSDAEILLDTLEDAANAYNTEAIGNVADITAENVVTDDKPQLEKAKDDLEKALEDYNDNYTEEEKKSIGDQIQRVDNALAVIEKVLTVEETIIELPKTAVPDDDDAIASIEDANDAYNVLSDYQQSIVDDDLKAKLEKLNADITAYDIISGDGSSWVEDSDGKLTITANGSFKKFVGIQVDGKDVDDANYTAKSGSTIITLKDSFLDTLAVGPHTITVMYTDGKTDGAFHVITKVGDTNSDIEEDNNNIIGGNNNVQSGNDNVQSGNDKAPAENNTTPAGNNNATTGDGNNIILWLVAAVVSAGFALTISSSKKRAQ